MLLITSSPLLLSSSTDSSTTENTPKDALWHRLDDVVLQWIYSTISIDLLNQILEDESTAQNAWTHCAAYCQEIKVLPDQLRNVGDKVSDNRMVLQLIAGLNDNFDTVGTYFTQMDKLPSFYDARSKLILEETRKKKQAINNSTNIDAALVASAPKPSVNSTLNQETPQLTDRSNSSTHVRSNNTHGRGGRGYNNNRGRSNRGRGRNFSPNPSASQWQNYPPWSYAQWTATLSWAPPPCPFPTTTWARPNNNSSNSNQPGILGHRLQHAHYSHAGYTPTDLNHALHTMTLNPPDDTWYMDTGATSHMTANSGNLESYYPLRQRKNIIVGNGHGMPISGFGHSTLSNLSRPLYLHNILHSPNLIKNLISVRRLSIDNNISMEFDPFGFTVKNFPQGTLVLKCDSTSDLYPLTTSVLHHLCKPSTFAALSSDIWHHRLGHSGDEVLRSLSNKKFISCNKQTLNSICQACVFGKQIKLPYVSSSSTTLSPFDIIHSDLWTSPVSKANLTWLEARLKELSRDSNLT
ncbi:uncharacterized protein [Rutidosis leptorrhynchoides]|uniref:uncharacterized protein n=1 Tax=Rutidosis leptorrhynchoides TaxID=125765 RepID=UPI003A98EBC1